MTWGDVQLSRASAIRPPTDIVVNDFMAVHPDVDGTVVTRVFIKDAEQWERIADVGFRAGVPDEFDALHFIRKRRGGDSVHVAVVVVNRDTGVAYVDIFPPEQLNDAARAEPSRAEPTMAGRRRRSGNRLPI